MYENLNFANNFEEKKILDPKNDLVFQKLFGSEENKELLIELLNSILYNEVRSPIISVEFLDRKLDTQNILDEKIGILDVRVKTNEDSNINPQNIDMEVIEMESNSIKKAKNCLENLSKDKDFTRLVELREKALLDERSNMEGAKAEGIKEGEKSEKIKIAMALKTVLDDEIIALKTGLSIEEVKNLAPSVQKIENKDG